MSTSTRTGETAVPGALSSTERRKLEALLRTLRDTPEANTPQTALTAPYDFLLGVPPLSTPSSSVSYASSTSRTCKVEDKHKNNGNSTTELDTTPSATYHWFCPLARTQDPLIPEAATFLLRLHGYTSTGPGSKVDTWLARLKSVLRGCAGCVKGLQDAKVGSRTTYFGAFSDDVVSAFWASFAALEAKLLKADLDTFKSQYPSSSGDRVTSGSLSGGVDALGIDDNENDRDSDIEILDGPSASSSKPLRASQKSTSEAPSKSSTPALSTSRPSLADLPLPTLYHILSHPTLFYHAELHAVLVELVSSSASTSTSSSAPMPLEQSLSASSSTLHQSTHIQSRTPSDQTRIHMHIHPTLSTTPNLPPPVGLIYALASSSVPLRTWAGAQLGAYTQTSSSSSASRSGSDSDLDSDNALTPADMHHTYGTALRSIMHAIEGVSSSSGDTSMSMSDDAGVLWGALAEIVGHLPLGVDANATTDTSKAAEEEMARAPGMERRPEEIRMLGLEIRDLVRGHLGDTSNHFPPILRTLDALLHAMGSAFWDDGSTAGTSHGGGGQHPVMKEALAFFDGISQNQAFVRLLNECASASAEPGESTEERRGQDGKSRQVHDSSDYSTQLQPWIRALLASLSGRTVPMQVWTDVLNRVLGFLLGDTGFNSSIEIDTESKTLCIRFAAQLLRDLLADTNPPSDTKTDTMDAKTIIAAKRQKTIMASLGPHINVLVGTAFPSSSSSSPSPTSSSSNMQFARTAVRSLLQTLLTMDVSALTGAVEKLARGVGLIINARTSSSSSSKDKDKSRSTIAYTPLIFSTSLWTAVFTAIQSQPRDSDAIGMLLDVVGPLAPLDYLNLVAFNPLLYTQDNRGGKDKVENAEAKALLNQVNAALKTAHAGVGACVREFADSCPARVVVGFLIGKRKEEGKETGRRDGKDVKDAKDAKDGSPGTTHETRPVGAVIALLMSPIAELNMAGQALVSQAFDVDGRAEAFRALFDASGGSANASDSFDPLDSQDVDSDAHTRNASQSQAMATTITSPVGRETIARDAYAGVQAVLNTFDHWARQLPEACGLSKGVVRCLTDLIDVLSAPEVGLLRDEAQFRSEDSLGTPPLPPPAANVQRLWTLMTQTSTVIFKYTPNWARALGDATDTRAMMVTWMRDALIFGRDMLAQRRVFETAAIRVDALERPHLSSVRAGERAGGVKRRMLEDLKPMLSELTRWLRLSEEELLHQSFALLQTLYEPFVEYRRERLEREKQRVDAGGREKGKEEDGWDVKPDQDAIERMKKITTMPNNLVKLDAGRMAQLREIVVEEEESADEVQIVDHEHQVKSERSEKETRVKKEKDGKQRLEVKKEEKERKVLKFEPGSGKIHQVVPKASAGTSSWSKYKQHKQPIAPRADGLIADLRRNTASGPTFSKKDIIRAAPSGSRFGSSSRQPKFEGRRSASAKSDASTSESESDEDDEQTNEPKGLAALANLDKTPTIKKPVHRGIKMMNDSEVGLKRSHQDRLARTVRDDAKRTAMRLKPDISHLHRLILAWDYDVAISGGSPPNSKLFRPIHVADAFASYDVYRRTFESLLILEAWAGLVQSKDEPKESYSAKITSRQTIDDWTDMDFTLADSVSKEWFLADTDVVLLKRNDNPKSILAKVQSYQARGNTIQGSLRVFLGNNGAQDPGLQVNSSWLLCKVFALSTIHREYAALLGLQYYDYLDCILKPRLERPRRFNEDEVKRTMAKYVLNEPQSEAILGALQSDEFCLIQGPPGTGKTTTICGLVKACLAKRARPLADPSKPNEKLVLPKILVCAPSNAAIDEVAHRLKDKVENVLRIGAERTINVAVKDISLDALVDAKLANSSSGEGSLKEITDQVKSIRSQLDAVRNARQEKENALVEIRNDIDLSRSLEDEIRKLKQRRLTLTQQLDKLRDQQRDGSRTLDTMRRRFRMEVLQEADVICSTLSGAAHNVLEMFESFEMVVIDEAAQAIELSSLIPLKYRTKRCVMVGDPQQLPPTVLSMEAKKFKYDQSLFVRLQKQRPEAVYLLSIQYRMHPEISQLPSEVFYQKKLLDGPAMDEKTKQGWHRSPMFPPYCFFNVGGQEQSAFTGSSLVNRTEAQVAAALYARLQKDFPLVDFSFRVGVVSMYRAQIVELKKVFRERFGMDILEKVDFNTVDGFQGQEKDIIILSCVRASTGGTSVGFLADVRRMNVALTRARSSLFILGHASTLQRSDDNWKTIVANAKSRSRLVEGSTAYFSRPGQPLAPAIANIPSMPTMKGVKRKASPDPESIPSGLTTPSDFHRKASTASSAGSSAQPPDVTDASEMDASRAPTPLQNARSSSPTPMDVDQSKQSSRPPRPKPNRPPPPKKPKTALESMFIPKRK